MLGTQVYCAFYEFAQMPFDNTPDPRFFFMTAGHEEALAALSYGVAQQRGFTAVTGAPGSGKTLLGQMLVQSLQLRADVCTISHTPESAQDLLTSMCRDLGVRYRASHTTGELVDRLRAALVARRNEERLAVVLVDEAQNLSIELFEHLRMLGNLELDTTKLLQVVLLGQLELVEVLRDGRLEQLRQRIFCSRTIESLARDETRNYVRHRLRTAGGKNLALFSDEAIDLIHEQSGGIPRMINQIADNSLLVGYGGGHRRIDRQTVAEAVQQMMGLQVAPSRPSTVIPGMAPQAFPGQAPSVPAGLIAAPPPPDSVEVLARSLNVSAQAAAEITGRLGELSHGANQQIVELANVVGKAESAAEGLAAGRASTGDLASACAARQEALDRLVRDAAQSVQRLEAARVAADRATDELSRHKQEAERTVHQVAKERRSAERSAEGIRRTTREASEQSGAAIEALGQHIRRVNAASVASAVEVGDTKGAIAQLRRFSGEFKDMVGELAATVDDAPARLG